MPPQHENYRTMAGYSDGCIGNGNGSVARENGDDDEALSTPEQELPPSRRKRRSSSISEHMRSLSLPPEHSVCDDDPSVLQSQSFIKYFASSRGGPHVIFLVMLVALALGSTIGVVPAVVTDRYARLNHGFDGSKDCAEYGPEEKPRECLEGSADAQNASAASSFVSNGLTFVTSSLVGSISDERGRRGILLLGIFLSLFGPLNLVLLQLIPAMSPNYYYVSTSLTGIVNWVTIGLSSLSDVTPCRWRAPCFGLLLASFSLGFAFSPTLALGMSHRDVSILALGLLCFGFLFALCFLPETLPREMSQRAVRARAANTDNETTSECLIRNLLRPMRELSILNRDRLFRILSLLAFFSGMSSSADHSLLLYYCQEKFSFGDGDVASMFMIMGALGIFVQGVVLKPLNECLGERLVVVVAFAFGVVHNVLYGLATSKGTIFAGVALATITGVSFPTISAIKSNNVEEHEQGRIQGALYSLSSLASAVGPVSLRFVYHFTHDNPYPGPGTMFLFAALLYLVATAFACALPKDRTNSSNLGRNGSIRWSVELDDDDEGEQENSSAALLP